jgi:hypothetical protein
MMNLCLMATRQEIELHTRFEYPPIPIRSFDWSAIDAATYDADWDGERYVAASPTGRGRTELAAIHDLFDQLESSGEDA